MYTLTGSSEISLSRGQISDWSVASGNISVTKPSWQASTAVIFLLNSSISVAFPVPIIRGNTSEEHASGDWPKAVKGVWNQPYVWQNKKHFFSYLALIISLILIHS